MRLIRKMLLCATLPLLALCCASMQELAFAASSAALTPEQFGAAGDGATDDTTALTNFINAVMASSNRTGNMPAKNYAISAALPTINVSGVSILGVGPHNAHSVVPAYPTDVTLITYTGTAGATMLTVSPVAGSSNQYLQGVRIKGISFNCNQLAANALVWQSVRNGEIDIFAGDCTTAGLTMSPVATLGDPPDVQFNRIRYKGYFQNGSGANGIGLLLNGTSTANVSLNVFEDIDIFHTNGLGIRENNADNNIWENVRVFHNPSGSATNSVWWGGSNTYGANVRDEQWIKLSATLAPIAKAIGLIYPAANIKIYNIDKGNSTPDPTVESGASVWWQDDNTPMYPGTWTSYTPRLTPQSGAFGSSPPTATGSYQIGAGGHIVYYSIAITFQSSNSVGTAGGWINATLPFANNASQSFAGCGWEGTTGVSLIAKIPTASAVAQIVKYDGVTFYGANGYVLLVSGFYQI